jgi:hypothetical protein
MVIKTNYKFIKHITRPLLLIILSGLQPVMAGLLDPPVITLSVVDCKKAYMVQIFEDGRVEYRGGFGVKAEGWHNANINSQDVTSLLKKFKKIDSIQLENREDLPGVNSRKHGLTVIQLNQNGSKLTFYAGGKLGSPLLSGIMSVDKLRSTFNKNLNVTFALLQLEIIGITNLQQWVLDPTQSYCLDGASIRVDSLKTRR